MHLAKAAKIVCNEMLKHLQSFNGTFPSDCEDNSIPQSLKAIIGMIMKGPGSGQREMEEVHSNRATLQSHS